MTKNSDNLVTVNSLVGACLHGTNDGGNVVYSNVARASNILDVDNNLVENSDYVFKNETPQNGTEKLGASGVKIIAGTSVLKGQSILARSKLGVKTYVIGFDKNSSKYNPILDNDENGKINELELKSAIKYLNDNIGTEANIIGNASLETTTVDNVKLAKDRATTTAKEIKKEGVSGSRIRKREEYSSGGSSSDNPKDRRSKIEIGIKRPEQ